MSRESLSSDKYIPLQNKPVSFVATDEYTLRLLEQDISINHQYISPLGMRWEI